MMMIAGGRKDSKERNNRGSNFIKSGADIAINQIWDAFALWVVVLGMEMAFHSQIHWNEFGKEGEIAAKMV